MARNPIIERALKKGFKSGGTIGDIGGGTGDIVSSSGGGFGGSVSSAKMSPETMVRGGTIPTNIYRNAPKGMTPIRSGSDYSYISNQDFANRVNKVRLTQQRVLNKDIKRKLIKKEQIVKEKDIRQLLKTYQIVPESIIKREKTNKMFGGGVISGIKKQKGFLDDLAKIKREELTKIQRSESPEERIVRGTIILGLLGGARGVIGVYNTITNPLNTAKGLFEQVKHPIKTLKVLGETFVIDPVGTVAEFYTYGKTLNVAGKGIKRSKVGRYVHDELFIRSQPKELRKPIRAIIESNKVQEKLNPNKVGKIKKVDFAEIKSLNKIEAKALKKTLQNTDSVVFGSVSARTLSKKKTPLPKDVDLATRNIKLFETEFIKNLPKKVKKNYKIKKEKIIRISDKEALFDVKPLERLIPDKSVITKRGYLPVSGYVRKLTKKKTEVLPKLRKKAVTGATEVPTQKLVKVEGIKMTSFGEQTTRKGLGTLQVLIEKNAKRAKDPQSFIIALEIQRNALKKIKSKSPIKNIINRNRINKLDSALKVLKSKEFSNLLDKRVSGLTKEFPILSKINKKKLKNIDIKTIKKDVKRGLLKEKVIIPKKKIDKIGTTLKKGVKKVSKKIGKKSYLPSKLPRKTSFTPSIIPEVTFPSIFPIKPSRIITKPPKDSKIPPSKMPESKVPPSRIPPSEIPPSKIPPSKLPPSRIPTSKLPTIKLPPSKIPPVIKRPPKRLPKKKKQQQRKKEKKEITKGVAVVSRSYINGKPVDKIVEIGETLKDALLIGSDYVDKEKDTSFSIIPVNKKGKKYFGSSKLNKFTKRHGRWYEKQRYRQDSNREKSSFGISRPRQR